jgi:hypothetical protein
MVWHLICNSSFPRPFQSVPLSDYQPPPARLSLYHFSSLHLARPLLPIPIDSLCRVYLVSPSHFLLIPSHRLCSSALHWLAAALVTAALPRPPSCSLAAGATSPSTCLACPAGTYSGSSGALRGALGRTQAGLRHDGRVRCAGPLGTMDVAHWRRLADDQHECAGGMARAPSRPQLRVTAA